MEVLKNIIVGFYLVVCVVLIVLVLKQTKDDNGASGAIVGGASSNFYEKNKGRTREGKLKRATMIGMILFFVLSITIGIIYV